MTEATEVDRPAEIIRSPTTQGLFGAVMLAGTSENDDGDIPESETNRGKRGERVNTVGGKAQNNNIGVCSITLRIAGREKIRCRVVRRDTMSAALLQGELQKAQRRIVIIDNDDPIGWLW